jgi:hypothetical protein
VIFSRKNVAVEEALRGKETIVVVSWYVRLSKWNQADQTAMFIPLEPHLQHCWIVKSCFISPFILADTTTFHLGSASPPHCLPIILSLHTSLPLCILYHHRRCTVSAPLWAHAHGLRYRLYRVHSGDNGTIFSVWRGSSVGERLESPGWDVGMVHRHKSHTGRATLASDPDGENVIPILEELEKLPPNH